MRSLIYPSFILLIGIIVFRQSFLFDLFIIGGEGNYFLDFTNYIQIFKYPWMSKWGMGYFNPLISGTGYNIFILSFFERIIDNKLLVNQILYFSIFTLPAISMFYFLNYFKINKFANFLISLFYIYNPFSLDYLHQFNQWTNTSLIFFPLMFLILSIQFNSKFVFFLIIFCFFNIISFSFANPPTFLIYAIGACVYLFVIDFTRNNFDFRKYLLSLIIIFLALFISNFYWIYNLLINISSSGIIDQMYSEETKSRYLFTILKNSGPIISQLFSFVFLGSDLPNYDTNYSIIFKTIYFKVGISVLVISVIFYNLFTKDKRAIFFSASTILFLYFAKGLYQPLTSLYLYLYEYFPLFSMFKTPTEKFGLLYIIFFIISLAFFSKNINSKIFNIIFIPVIIVLLFIPITKGVISPYQLQLKETHNVDRLINLDKEFFKTIEIINNLEEDRRVLILPGMYNYQLFLNINDSLYSGLDPILNNTNKDYVEFSHKVFNPSVEKIYSVFEKENLSNDEYKENVIKKLFDKNICYIVIYKNVENLFGVYNEPSNIIYFSTIFRNDLIYENEFMQLYDLSKYNYNLQEVYTKEKLNAEFIF